MQTLGFGKYFSDHMFMMDYSREEGWHDARIVPFAPITLHPASTVLHYGSEIFEGLKAYRRADGKVQMFRPIENIRRMNRSADRMCLPQIPEDMAMEALTTFVKMEEDWTPSAPGTSLYLRPFMIATEAFLGVRPSREVSYRVIASPAGNYFGGELKPVSIWLSTKYARAGIGGTGEAKCGGNYAASLIARIRPFVSGLSRSASPGFSTAFQASNS